VHDVSGRHVELASMARAGDNRRFEVPLGERAPLMRAGVPERVEGAADACDRDPGAAHVEGRQLTVPQLVESSHGELCHGTTSSLNVVAALLIEAVWTWTI
jgi:hypothetical protein